MEFLLKAQNESENPTENNIQLTTWISKQYCMLCCSKTDQGFECHVLWFDKGLVSFSPFLVAPSTRKTHFMVTGSSVSNANKTWMQ